MRNEEHYRPQSSPPQFTIFVCVNTPSKQRIFNWRYTFNYVNAKWFEIYIHIFQRNHILLEFKLKCCFLQSVDNTEFLFVFTQSQIQCQEVAKIADLLWIRLFRTDQSQWEIQLSFNVNENYAKQQTLQTWFLWQIKNSQINCVATKMRAKLYSNRLLFLSRMCWMIHLIGAVWNM